MSWFNPTEEEAEEQYYYYKSKYNSACNSLRASERKEENCISVRNSALKKADAAKKEKKNDEKRLKEIEEILKILEGGSWFGADAPDAIEDNNSAVKNADESYKKCIRCDGITAADIGQIFSTDTVEQHSGSSQALTAFRAEAKRLRENIEKLKKTIQTETALAEEMRKEINRCNIEQSTYRSRKSSALYNMNHYKKYF